MIFQTELTISTTGHRYIEDLTARIERAVKESGIKTGIVNICNVGSTAAVGTIEYEPGLCQDLGEILDRLMPPSRDYAHEQAWHDGNGHSHLQASIMGNAFTAPVKAGRLALGPWQQIIILECDVRPRKRTVTITIIGQ